MANQQRQGGTKPRKKIRKYRRPLNLNIGMIIFAAIFIYVVICIVEYMQSNPPKPYEVQEGSLAINSHYRGLALRTESVVTANTAGYTNYYVREGERVAIGDLVYTVDETGSFNDQLADSSMGESTLDAKDLAQFRNEIVNFMHGFDPLDFGSVYSFKYDIKGTVLRLANENMLENLQGSGAGVETCTAPATGIVAYWVDGYEGLTTEQITIDMYEDKEYTRNQLLDTSLVAAGDPVYKLSTEEEWMVVIPVTPEDGVMLEEEGYVKVRFQKNQYESWASTKLFTNADGQTYVSLSFTNSMLTFISDRFLEIELLLNEETGLKIPVTAIAYRDFYLIPESFVTVNGENERSGILRQTYLEDGTISSEFVETEIYSFDEETKEYYLDTSVLNAGDILLKTDSQETYTVSKIATLTGVYNMNKGYADFREIRILNQNEEYAIVESNTTYGLNVYDNIVLDASSVTDEQFLFR